MPAPTELLQLVDRFHRNIDAYKSGAYNETQARREFIDPLFKLLGWDTDNTQGYAEAYKDVVHEDAVKIGGATKAPDYCFRIGGTRKFFLEAKKPSVNIKEDENPAFQLRRYAWSAKLPLSVLTDFEEFAVYDCRVKPVKTDKASTGRTLYLKYTDYPARWEELASIFSREAVLKGSFDKYAESAKAKKGTAEVDAAFLREIESWRDSLAKNLALRNPSLAQRELNFAVQRIIDRVIFLRICEDRGMEMYGRLMALQNGSDVYRRLCHLFQEADNRYNSGLFHFRKSKDRPTPPDDLTLNLSVDDKVLKDIFRNLYYPDSPYEFSVLPSDILGQVYEQFLGKVIRLTSGHRAQVEDKPEVKKAGGVFYTPTYIVDYIVKETVGKLLDGKKPGPKGSASKVSVLDPACGSGSFLIGAYQYLLDWHRDQYLEAGPERHKKELFQAQGGEWRLTTTEKKRILLNNIYGVDIDAQAVETTKLSLLLKVLEGESGETITKQWKLLHERALPDLGNNIKCGNSLIGPDFYNGKQLNFFDDDERHRVNVFDWEAEFPEIMKDGGFDAVIGNPPYVRIQAMKEWIPLEVAFYKTQYQVAKTGSCDIYVMFVEKGLNLLNKSGRLGFILPHKFFNAQYGKHLREIIAKGAHLSKIIHFGDQQVFDGATTYTCLMFLNKNAGESFQIVRVENLNNWQNGKIQKVEKIKNRVVTSSEWNFTVGKSAPLFEKLSKTFVKLGEVSTGMFVGLQTSADTIFLFKKYRNESKKHIEVFSKKLNEWIKLEKNILKQVVRSGDIGQYWVNSNAYILFPYLIEKTRAKLIEKSALRDKFPLCWDYLERNKQSLESREKGAFKDTQWYRFGRTQNLGMWEQPKILVPYMVTQLSAYPDLNDNFYFINVTTGGYGITLNENKISYLYLSGLLNSRLLDFCFKQVSTTFHGGYFAANKQYIEKLPIRAIDFSNPSDKSRHDRIVSLVDRMLDLNKELQKAKTAHDQTALKRQIDATDKEIDRLVYELYGLAEEEIKIVEGL
ncbi:MAG: Eco57I restriction-modification methylase domain-containing protein [Nitrospinae bacterium]|nr:Eco57I restriction-modification methylase domain-containing protein [Nitrospinota bacterium]